ncbi:MAG: radical SAM protein [Muribaculaceae bacterium]|nr:radical SAM protein [Roseburia sp.]MCM1430047.1 radical SAM protein [Muribaculaceae bacterium]MCM1492926.1 radical SAM protein [Muribaculaceae bacterium]
MDFKEITVCLDMHGCPNRCRHCWVGATPNGNMDTSEIAFAAEQFRPFTNCLEILNWYREPDFHNNYRELWELCKKYSDKHTEHFELISVWRLVRDREYVKWLSSLGLKAAQLTVFGDEETTDFYTGRKGAYRDIIKAIEILLENRIAVRIQTFINKENIDKLAHIEWLIGQYESENISFFLHPGSCDGENEKLYDMRVTPGDIEKIPEKLAEYTCRYMGTDKLMDVFGKTEQFLYEKLQGNDSTESYVSESPVFYVDRNFNIYPNISTPAQHWYLGNIKTDSVEAILTKYRESGSIAMHTRLTVPIGEIVRQQGDRGSQRLFEEEDYITFLLNKYCRA